MEMSASDMIEIMREAGFMEPHPAGQIVSRSKNITVKRFFNLVKGTERLEYWRLWLGGKEFRDFDTLQEAEAARVLRGLGK